MAVPVEYRDVPGFPGYQIGSDGTLWKTNKGERKQLQGSVEHTPYNVKYRAFFLYRSGKQATIRAHKLVAMAFFGECPKGHEIRHIDGDGLNNRLTNLAYGTRSENMRDRDTHGTMIRGEKHCFSKVSDLQVEEIRRLHAAGMSNQSLAQMFGISKSHVAAIINRIWRRKPAHAH